MKTVSGVRTLCEHSKSIVSIGYEIWSIKERHGRAGPARISVLHRKPITFCSMNRIDKTIISRVRLLFCFPIWLWKEALCCDQRDAITLSPAPLSSRLEVGSVSSSPKARTVWMLKPETVYLCLFISENRSFLRASRINSGSLGRFDFISSSICDDKEE